MTSRLFYHKETGAPVQIIARAQTKPTYQEVICYQELTKPYDHFVMEKRQFFAEYVKEFAELPLVGRKQIEKREDLPNKQPRISKGEIMDGGPAEAEKPEEAKEPEVPEAIQKMLAFLDAESCHEKIRILEEMQVPLNRIHHLFVTHEHTDHILGVIWMIRMIGTAIKKGNYEGIFHIYCHDGLIDTIQTFCRLTLQKKFCDLIGDPIQLIPVSDRETRQILDMKVTFFDIHSTKARQFGFRSVLPDGKIVCCPGDEPLNPLCEEFAKGADWLFHEAFCLYRDREIFSPYEKHHSTVKDACELAERLGARHLILWHTEDKTYPERAALYRAEGEAYYHGDLLVPEDGSVIEL